MQQIPLSAEPNQQFNVLLEEVNYGITLRALDQVMLLSLTADDVPLITGAVCFANQPVILYPYLIKKGNFIFKTENNQYPYYSDFDNTCFLYYITAQEWREAQNG